MINTSNSSRHWLNRLSSRLWDSKVDPEGKRRMEASLDQLRINPDLEGLKAWLALRALELVSPQAPVANPQMAAPNLYSLGFRAGQADFIRELILLLDGDTARLSALSSQAYPEGITDPSENPYPSSQEGSSW